MGTTEIMVYSHSDDRRKESTSIGTNVSSINDHLIRLAAKLTEHYASDVIYECVNLLTHVESKTAVTRYIGFREDGVTAFETAESAAQATQQFYQMWELTYNPDENAESGCLRRVRLVTHHGE